MRIFSTPLLAAALLVGAAGLAPGTARAQFTTDGAREAAYGAPLAVQTNTTGFGNSTLGDPLLANGSELDGAYAVVSGGMLHLFLAGNLETNGNKLEVFFNTKAGGQNTLLANNPDVDSDGLNAMAGLTFDAGFGADYFLTATFNSGSTGLAVSFATLNDPVNVGTLLADGLVVGQPLVFGGAAPNGELGLNNSNTAGVDGMSVGVPAAVATGIELVIPLAALGAPTADLRVCAFINGTSHNFLSNQMLAPLPFGTANIGPPDVASLADATNVGDQFFTVTNGGPPPPVATISVSPNPLDLGPTAVGSTTTGALTVHNTGAATLVISAVTSSNAVFSATPATATIAAGDSATLTVTFAPTVAGTQTDTLTIVSNADNAPTFLVTVTGFANPPVTASVDGQLDAGNAYGAALAVQTAATGFGDATAANLFAGSELDAAYARIANGNLYLLLTGNLQANGNDLEIFLDTQAGGQSVLSATNPNVDNDGLNRLAGLTFDAGFAPDFYLTVQHGSQMGAAPISVSYAALTGAGGTGTLLTSGATGPVQALNFGGSQTGALAINNTNEAGVSDLTVGNPAAVTTGVELEIPLAALGNPVGPLRISAFVNGASHDFVSNQVLAGLPVTTANLGDPATVNFPAAAGDQFFTVAPAVLPAPVASVSPDSLDFGNVAPAASATRPAYVHNGGNAPLSVTAVTTNNPRFTAAPTTGTVAPGDSLAVTVTFAPTAVGAQTDTLTITTNDPANPTLTVALRGAGAVPAVIVVDGSQDAGYGGALAVQTTPTGFGNATTGNQQTAAGSELDAAYARIDNGNLYLLLTGNLETNGNHLELFFDTRSGLGQRTLGANNPDVDNNGLNAMAGLTFDNGFTADYYLTLSATAPTTPVNLLAGFGAVNGAGGVGTTLANGPGRIQPLVFGAGLTGALGLDNSNVAGVSDVAVGTPGAVTTGVELAIPLAALGNPSGPIRISAFINNIPHTYLSNQALGGFPANTGNLGGDGMGNPAANLAGINFANFAGSQFFTVTNGTAAPVITASAAVLTFPAIVAGTTSTQRLVVRNVGNAPLTLTGVTSTDPNFSAAPTTGPVAVGDSLVLTVTFAPTAAGSFNGSLLLTSNDPGQPTLSVGLIGTATAAAGPVISVRPDSIGFGGVQSTAYRVFYVRNTGTAPLMVTGITSSVPAFIVSLTTATVAPGDSAAVVVTFEPFMAAQYFDSITVASNDPLRPTVRVLLTGSGTVPSPFNTNGGAGIGEYGAPLAVQTTPTGFGDATNGQIDVALNGSELDAAYARVANGNLYLLLTGNLESNGNNLELFFDTQAGGQNTLLNTNPDVDNNGLNAMAGLTFDAGFAPEYYLTFNNTNPTTFFRTAAYFGAVNGLGGTGQTLADGFGRVQPLTFGAGLTGELALDNSNTAGVNGTVLGNPAGVFTGVELAIPLAALGNPTGPIRISAFINGTGHDFVSNQVLGGLPLGTANLGAPAAVSFATPAGNQFFVVPNGATAAISLSATSLAIGNITVGSIGTATFYVRNRGGAALNLTNLTSSAAPFTATPGIGTIAPGDSLLVTVAFAPTAVGPQSATLTLTSDDPANPTVTVQVTGTGVAVPAGILTVSTTSLNLGSVAVGGTTTATFTVSNTGNAPIALVSLGLPPGSVFSVSPTTINPLAPGNTVTVTVTFAPTTGGPQTATVGIQQNGIPFSTVVLTGNGVVGLPTELTAAVALTPNPSTGRATLRLPAALLTAGAATVEVLDALGRPVRTVAVPPAGAGPEVLVPLDLTGLAAGTYAVRLRTAEGSLVRRLVLLAE